MEQEGTCDLLSATSSRLSFHLAAVALVIASFSGSGFLMLTWLQSSEPSQENAKPTPPAENQAPSRLFQGWPTDRKPDVVLLLTGQVYGYMQPCGCSEPQYGGLERRYNFINQLSRDRGWTVVAVDLGDVAQKTGPQTMLKYKYIMEAMKTLNYTAVAIGKNEMALPLFEALGEFAVNNPRPRLLCANLLQKDNFPGVASSEVAAKPNSPKVGVVGVVSAGIAKDVKDETVKFADVEPALKEALTELQKAQAEVRVLLYQGDLDDAQACAAKFPQFQVILSLSRDEEPPATPEMVGNTMVVNIGHKGRCLGLVGIYRTGKRDKPFELFYEMVRLGPELQTPQGKDANNPMLALYERYSKEVKDRNFLANYPKLAHPIQQNPDFQKATYVGSERCKKCHEESYKIWKASPHARAYASLVNAKRPSLRQYDGECVQCHVVGFAYTGGYENEAKTPMLLDNGCENCHGPASLHVNDEHNAKLLALMNPYKTPEKETDVGRKARILRLNDSCQKCHDIDNDVHWDIKKWEEGKIVHKEPKE